MRVSLAHQAKTVLTLSCDQSSRLVSDSQERDLLRYERLALRLHMVSCKGCQRMRRHFKLLHDISARLRLGKAPRTTTLTQAGRERIKQHLQKN